MARLAAEHGRRLMADAENHGLTPAQLDKARVYVRPLIDALANQGGGCPVVSITNGDGSSYSLVAAHIRKLRRVLWPAPAEFAHLFDPYAERTAESEAERRRVRAMLWPERPREAGR